MLGRTDPVRDILKVEAAAIAYSLRRTEVPLVCCLHGIGSSRHVFASLFDQEELENCTILTIDMMGHGDSGPSLRDYSMSAHAAVCKELIAALDLSQRPISLICHSVGGAVGVLLASGLGDQLKGFLNLEGNLIAEDCGLITRRTISRSYEDFVATDRAILAAEIAAQGEDNAAFLRCVPEAFYRTAQSVVEWSDSGKLLEIFVEQLTCRREYILGDRNNAMPILSKLPGITKVAISDSGHVMMLDNPPGFHRAVCDFLRQPSRE